MEWLTCLKESIDYMESNLLDIRSPEEVADYVHVSCMYLQRGFQILTGYTLGEYMRNRKMYLAAVEIAGSTETVIDIGMKYGYETPASFNKAFVRFHGATPMDVRKSRGKIRSFLRLNISIAVNGGEGMEFRIEKKNGIRIVGVERLFEFETSYEMIPKFWDDFFEQSAPNLMSGKAPSSMREEYIASHNIGEFGLCVDDAGAGGKFNYMIGGYADDEAPLSDMNVREIPAGEWAVFDCTLKNLQQVNTAIWSEWLPGNNEYELSGKYNIEWYSPEGIPGPDHKCEIWIPVKRKA